MEPYCLIVTSTDDELPDSYVTSPATLEYDFHFWVDTKIVVVQNTDEVNSLNYCIEAALSEIPTGTDWVPLVGDDGDIAEQTLAPGENDWRTTRHEWRWIRVNCKNDSAGNVAKAKVEVRCVRRP